MKIKRLVYSALIAAIYAALTYLIAPIAYGPIQFRISEIMVLLVLVDPFYIVGLTLGCFLANLLGPYGFMDITVGTLATFVAVVLMSGTIKIMKDSKLGIIVASLWPTVINGVFIGYMLYYVVQAPLLLTMFQVGVGEFVVVTVVGVPIYLYLKEKNIFKRLGYRV
ncbi:QueT transporter family protein [Clostridium sp. YIM B02551]|uniref:QueT transporter family protein n=1 Tax=Clostridium sp. YIM B02551 TaxID=2910679 RepID=UPI001EE9F552|nr:QueT transporter family protein [Clostridium sp. YIM B02551]